MTKGGARRWLPHLAGGAAFLLFFHGALSGRSFVAARDALKLFLPLKHFVREGLRAGHLPTWWPDDGLGISLIGTSFPGLLHPLNLLLAPLDPARQVTLEAVCCCAWGLLGAYGLARRLGAPTPGRWLAAATFGLSGNLVSLCHNTTYQLTAANLPWVLWAAERLGARPGGPAAAGLGLALAASLWGGDVQGFGLALGAAVWVVALHQARPLSRWRERAGVRGPRRAALALAGAGALTGLLTAPVLWPLWQTFRQGSRSAGLPLDEAQAWSLSPARAFEAAFGQPYSPGALDESAWDLAGAYLQGHNHSLWSTSVFLGLPALLCAALALGLRLGPARTRWTYGLLAGAGLLLSLGRFTPLYALAYRLVPTWRAFRYPEKCLPLLVLGLAVLAGLGVRALRAPRRGLALAALAAAGGVHLEGVTRLLAWLRGAGEVDPDLAADVAEALRARLGLGALVLLGLAVAALRGGQGARWAAAGLQLAQALVLVPWVLELQPVELAGTGSELIPPITRALGSSPRRICAEVPVLLYALRPEGTEAEINLRGDLASLAYDYGSRFGIGNLRPYTPGMPAALGQLCRREHYCDPDCTRAAGVRLGVVPPPTFERLARERPELRELARLPSPDRVLFEDPRARPFAGFPAVHAEPTAEAAQQALDSGRVDLASQVVRVGPGGDAPAPVGATAQARRGPDAIEVDYALPGDRPAWLVVSEGCAAGWSAALDGQPAPLEQANLSLCALQAPPGQHHASLRYAPPGWPGLFLPYALGWAALAWLLRRRATPA